MGCRNREFCEDESCSSMLSEALLFATMCLIGLPVEVHIKDGSVYSGIFHTASVDNQYGVVLKKARMTKKGKMNANVDDGAVIDTLVVLSPDLVQLVATEDLLPPARFSKSWAGSDNEAMENDPTSLLLATEAKTCMESFKESQLKQTSDLVQDHNGFAHRSVPTVSGKHNDVRQLLRDNVENKGDAQQKKERMNCKKPEDVADAAINWRQDPDNQLKKERDDHGQEFDLNKGVNVDRVQSSMSSEKPCTERPISANTTTNADAFAISTSSRSSMDSSMDSCRSSITSTTDIAPSHGSESNKSGKEFKLNPRAKLFSPSIAYSMAATPAAPMVANVAYISNNSPPVVPAAVAQPEVEFSPFMPRSSVPPAKFIPYGNSMAGFGGNVSQFSQPMVGHVGTRAQPHRYVGQYPVQAGPTFGPPNSSAVMVSRFGQLVYMQPVSHDLAQGATVVSPVPPCPLLTTQPAQYPKHHQGSAAAAAQALQFCVPQPFVASGHQPLGAVPNHIPILQPPFPLNRPMPMPMPVPGTNAFFSPKF